ncbi:MAG: ABC transporter ATP-binding protein, partial [Acidobacteriota bacterium]
MLQIELLNVFYGGIHALRGVSLSVGTGEVVALIGANGAGKSTTLRAITGLQPARSGRIRFEGEDIIGVAAHQIVARGISMCPEGRGVFANLTVLENLEMGAYLQRAKAQVRQDMDRGFALFPRLKERTTQLAGTLSGGEQQMLAIARALMSRPRLLLVDEASLGLSPALTQTVFSVVDRINNDGVTVILVEQNVGVLPYADRALIMEKGTLV